MTGRRAVILLTVMGIAAVSLVGAIVALIIGWATHTTGTPSASLMVPPPAVAGTLPVRSHNPSNPLSSSSIAQFKQRFSVFVHGRAGSSPDALYSEPGRADPVTNAPGWVMYVGFNARSPLGDPKVTVTQLMADIVGGTGRPWQVAAGSPGGTARCSNAVIDQTQMSVCGWATDRMAGAVMSPARDTGVNDLAALMAQMRVNLQGG